MQGGESVTVAGPSSSAAGIDNLPVKLSDPELVKPAGPTDDAPQYLSNIDQVLAFSVETVYFYRASPDKCSSTVASTLREALGKVLVAYPFLAGRLRLSEVERRLEVDCNRAGAQFGEAETGLSISDLGDVTIPNPAFRSLVPQAWGAAKITDVPLLMVQVTRFRCGGFSVGFTMGHINYDGIGAIEFLTNYTSLCKGGGILIQPNHDRTALRARIPPTPMFDHPEYISAADIAKLGAATPFTTTEVTNDQFEGMQASDKHIYRVFHFSAEMLERLVRKASGKEATETPIPSKANGGHESVSNGVTETNGGTDRNGDAHVVTVNGASKGANGGHITQDSVTKVNGSAENHRQSPDSITQKLKSAHISNGSSSNGKSWNKVSTFEALASHIWQARSRSVDWPHPSAPATLLFAVDIRNRLDPPLPKGICCNAVFSACARATYKELEDRPLAFCVERVQSAIARVTDEYVRSSLDWWEVHRGIPALPGGIFISAWWKLPFYGVDFGWGKPIFAGPIVSAMTEFVLLLPTGRPGGGLNVVIALKPHEMEKFDKFIHIYS